MHRGVGVMDIFAPWRIITDALAGIAWWHGLMLDISRAAWKAENQ